MFEFKNKNGVTYDVLAYDSQSEIALLKSQTTENNYVVARGLDNDSWRNGVYYTDKQIAHNHFAKEIYNSLEYKEKFRNLLEQEDFNLNEDEFNLLFEEYLNDDNTTGMVNREYIDELIGDIRSKMFWDSVNKEIDERQKDDVERSSFIDDKEKMRDFQMLSKEEFLYTYSYLNEDEYNSTVVAFKNGEHLNNEELNKKIIEKTINVFSGYRIVKPEDENNKGIYIILVDDIVRDGSIDENIEIDYAQMKKLVPEEEQYYYSSYGDALNQWMGDIRHDIYDLGLFFPDGNKLVYDFYLSPKELIYCGLGKEYKEELENYIKEEEIEHYLSNDDDIVDYISANENSI